MDLFPFFFLKKGLTIFSVAQVGMSEVIHPTGNQASCPPTAKAACCLKPMGITHVCLLACRKKSSIRAKWPPFLRAASSCYGWLCPEIRALLT